MLTQSFADAVLEAEKVIAGAAHVTSAQDLVTSVICFLKKI